MPATLPWPKIPKQPPKNRRRTPSRSTYCAARKRDERLRRRHSHNAHAATLRSANSVAKLVAHTHDAEADGCVLRVTPESAGWTYVGFAVYRAARSRERFDDRETCVVVLSGRANLQAGGREWRDAGGRGSVLRRPAHRALRPARPSSGRRKPSRLRRLHRTRSDRRGTAPARAGRRALRGARHGRRGPLHLPHPDGGPARRIAARHGGPHTCGALVELPAAQARRRRSAARDAARGDLLPPPPPGRTDLRSSASTRTTARSTSRSRPGRRRRRSSRAATTRSPPARGTTATT